MTMPPATDPLASLRQQINAYDDALIELLAKRYAILAEVVKVKAEYNIPHRVESRVQQVIARNEENCQKAGLPAGYATAIWTYIIEAAHAYEHDLLKS